MTRTGTSNARTISTKKIPDFNKLERDQSLRKDGSRSADKDPKARPLKDFVELANRARAIESEVRRQELAVADYGLEGAPNPLEEAVANAVALVDDKQGAINLARIMAKHLKGSGFEDLARRPKWDLGDVSISFAYGFLRAVSRTLTRVASLRRGDEVKTSKLGRKHHHLRVDLGQRVKYEPIVDREDFVVGQDGKLHRVGTYPAVREQARFRDALLCEVISQVRKCRNDGCLNLFWAGRADRLCCSKRCNDARSQREWYWAHKDDKKYATYVRERDKSPNGGKNDG